MLAASMTDKHALDQDHESSGPRPEDSAIPPAGSMIAGKYRVEEIIARGGVGVVLSAWHTVLNQRVAIKFLLPTSLSKRDTATRFLREARAASRIQNEHVVRILDMGTHDSGAPFLVMEYLVGTDLAQLIRRRGRARVEDAVEYVIQVCDALAEAHALGIVHRDLKPANLFLTERPDGSPFIKVVDFGMSKALLPEVMGGASIEVSLTATSVSVGSPAYMSPEQVRSAKHVDSRTDVWSLGIILYELLLGRPPFEANNLFGICAKITADSPPPIRAKRSDVSEELESVVFACLEKDVNHRIQNVAELSQALLPFASADSKPMVERITRVLSGTKNRSARPPANHEEHVVKIPSHRKISVSANDSEELTHSEVHSPMRQQAARPHSNSHGRIATRPNSGAPPAHEAPQQVVPSVPPPRTVSMLTLGLVVCVAVLLVVVVMLAIR